MATPTRSTPPKSGDPFGTVVLTLIVFGLAVGGLARWAQTNATVHQMLDWLTIPVLAFVADHSPEVDSFMRRSTLPVWLAIEAAMVIVPCFVAVGVYLMVTHETRVLRRAARQQLINKRRNQRIGDMTDEMEAKEQTGRDQSKTGRNPRSGEATTDADRLKDVFGKQPPEPPEGKKGFSLWRWVLGLP